MIFITNSFTLAMLPEWRLTDSDTETNISVRPVADPVAWLAEAEQRHGTAVSSVGHADTAEIYSNELGRDVAFNRVSIEIGENTEVLVGQYFGPRLSEGTTELPVGAKICCVVVTIQ